MRILTVFLILFVSLYSNSQDGVWEKWDTDNLSLLNTGKDVDYLNEEEKKVILFMNMARQDGTLFAETILETYVEQGEAVSSSYLRSLRRDLRKTEGLQPLVPEPDLTSIAQGHASRSGQSGHVGHRDFDKRFKPVIGNPYQRVGENCSYGYDQAVDIVVSLLIDEGVKDLGHRNNILNEGYNSVGVSIRPHKNYRINCVIDFGQQQRSGLNDPPI